MNRYEELIADYLYEFREVSLEKIGTIKLIGNYANANEPAPVEFTFDRKAATTPELINYIAQKASKSKMIVAADLESHLKQAREFINIGKTYEIENTGFIKKNNSGAYEFIPASQAVKAQKNFNKPVHQRRQRKKTGSSVVQIFTLIIVLAIVAGLCWEAYQFFVKPAVHNTAATETDTATSVNNNDTTANKKDSPGTNANTAAVTDTAKQIVPTPTYKQDDTVNVKYIFETTNLLIRAQSRTEKLISYGNKAGYDSVANGRGKLYSLYILKSSKVADTSRIKDSIAKFLQKPVEIKIASK